MKRSIGFVIGGGIILAIGLALGGSLPIGSGEVANAQGPGPVDGQEGAGPDTSMPDQAGAPSSPPAGALTYRAYSANEFLSTHSDLTYASYGPDIYALSIPGGGFSFKLPLDLPNGSQVYTITTYVVDNDDSHNMSIQFYRVKLSNSTQVELDSVSTASLPTSSATQTVTMSGSPITVIDYSQYAYQVRYGPTITGNSLMMAGVRIQYIAPVVFGVALPTIVKNYP